jgi:hypothetical protein
VPYDIRIDLTTEAPWANSWCGFRATVTNAGSEPSGTFELQYVFVGPQYEVARAGMGIVENLDPGSTHTTDELNVQPLEPGEHTLTVTVWQNGNDQGSETHRFTVQ